MKPYYKDDLVTLYHGDCLEFAEWLDADVLVTDPPYGTNNLGLNPMGGYGRRGNATGDRKGAPIGRTLEAETIQNDGTTETRDAALALWGNRPALVFGSPRLPDPPGDWADRLVREAVLHGPCESEARALLKLALEVRNERTTKLLRKKSQPARPNRNRTGQGITGS